MKQSITHNIPDQLTSAEAQALRQLLLETPTRACYSPEELVDYVTGILTPPLHQEVKAHLETCPLCAGAAIDLRQAFLPVITLQHGWGGWRGPILSAMRWLDPMLERAWQEQCSRHRESLQRTERARQILRVTRPTVAVARWSMVALALVVLFRPGAFSPQGVRESVDENNPPIIHVEKGVLPSTNPAESLVERALNPTEEQLPAAIRIMEHIATRNPGLLAPPATLKDLYTRALKGEHDPAQRRVWQIKLDKLNAATAPRRM